MFYSHNINEICFTFPFFNEGIIELPQDTIKCVKIDNTIVIGLINYLRGIWLLIQDKSIAAHQTLPYDLDF